ncbi:hypothetical protein NLG97_g11068 [Lecanicillium saksenae]|uniref:Uncharacterized protein n=1 Tax=Lecanicillium saksenae TaxID=468837 RepID=A0ACC1QD94_9HYPO|nr:hypothetical protein NLG97_g11068 [Lecanicillium saksenae]
MMRTLAAELAGRLANLHGTHALELGNVARIKDLVVDDGITIGGDGCVEENAAGNGRGGGHVDLGEASVGVKPDVEETGGETRRGRAGVERVGYENARGIDGGQESGDAAEDGERSAAKGHHGDGGGGWGDDGSGEWIIIIESRGDSMADDGWAVDAAAAMAMMDEAKNKARVASVVGRRGGSLSSGSAGWFAM